MTQCQEMATGRNFFNNWYSLFPNKGGGSRAGKVVTLWWRSIEAAGRDFFSLVFQDVMIRHNPNRIGIKLDLSQATTTFNRLLGLTNHENNLHGIVKHIKQY